MDSVSALHMAYGQIYHQLVQQSMLCAYMSSYKVYALVILIILPLVFTMIPVKNGD